MENQKERIMEMYEAEEARVLKLWRAEKERVLELFDEEEQNFKQSQKDNELADKKLYDELKEEIEETKIYVYDLCDDLTTVVVARDELDNLISDLDEEISKQWNSLRTLDEKLNKLFPKNNLDEEERQEELIISDDDLNF